MDNQTSPRVMQKTIICLITALVISLGTLGQDQVENALELTKTAKKGHSGAKNQREGMRGMDAVTSFYGDIVLNQFAQPYYVPPPYGTPMNFHLGYYGSGDVDNDGDIDFADHSSLLSSPSDRTDLNGNGTTTSADKQLLYDYLTDVIPYLPAHWELLQTSAEKIDWLQKMLAIDPTSELPYIPNVWECGEYATQTLINFAGIENIANSGLSLNVYDTMLNGRFNIPIYIVATVTSSNNAHAINCILTGEPANNFYSISFIEPQTDQIVTQGSQSLNQLANIMRFCYFYNEVLQLFMYGGVPLINFSLTGTPTVSWQHPDLIINKPAKFTYIHIGGANPPDIQIDPEDPTTPSTTGQPNAASWASTFYSDVDNRTGTVWDSTYWNYDIQRAWRAVSDSCIIIDTTYSSFDNTNFPNRTPQLITVRDVTNPYFTNVPSGSMLFTTYNNSGIPDSQGNDNCGYFTITRTTDSTNRIMNPAQCEYYEFTEWFTDHIEDPTGNFDDSSSFVNIELDPSIFSFVPPTYTANYGDPIDPPNTGGYATATNPAGVTVNISYVDSTTQLSDTTQCGHYDNDVWRKWWGVTDPCQDSIWALQLINVQEIEPPILTYVPPDTIVPIGGNIDPEYLGWSEGEDPVSGVPPTPDYYDEVIYQGVDSIYIGRHHWVEDICLTPSAEGIQYITQMINVGIEELGDESQVVVYPNPAHNKLNVEFSSGSNVSSVELVDLVGRTQVVVQVGRDQSKLTVDVSLLPKGIYLMKFFSGKKLVGVEKVVLID